MKELRNLPGFQITLARDWAKSYPPNRQPKLATIPLARKWLGDEAIQIIWYTPHYQGFSQPELERLAKFFPEAETREVHASPCHPGCFPGGTLVETPQGSRLIEGIQRGDLLTTYLPSGAAVIVPVQSIFITQNQLWQVETDQGVLLTTKIQPLCLSLDRILPTGELQPGDTILHWQAGEIHAAKVQKVTSTNRTEKVFNLVLGNSELFVAGGFLARSKPPVEASP